MAAVVCDVVDTRPPARVALAEGDDEEVQAVSSVAPWSTMPHGP